MERDRTSGSTPPHGLVMSQKLTQSTQAQIEDDGARAARAGCSWQSNPYLRRENMPALTGEDLLEWTQRHDAWQKGFEGNATGESNHPASSS